MSFTWPSLKNKFRSNPKISHRARAVENRIRRLIEPKYEGVAALLLLSMAAYYIRFSRVLTILGLAALGRYLSKQSKTQLIATGLDSCQELSLKYRDTPFLLKQLLKLNECETNQAHKLSVLVPNGMLNFLCHFIRIRRSRVVVTDGILSFDLGGRTV